MDGLKNNTMIKEGPLTIVIDFDGTCVTQDFPNVGKSIGAEYVLRRLIDHGHRLILFTMRSDIKDPKSNDPKIVAKGGNYLSDALEWFRKEEIPLYGIQTNPDQRYWTTSPKAYGDIIIDDAALGCPLTINKMLSPNPFVDWFIVNKYFEDIGAFNKK